MPLNANSAGIIAGTFTIPARVPIGTKRVRALGGQGSFAATRFIGEGAIVTSTLRQITTIETRFWDPLAQTFRLDAARYVTAVDLRFTARGSTTNQVVIEIRETELGLPNAVTLAEGILQGSSITVNAWNKISLTRPVYLQAGVEYAIVILTDDPTHAVALAELGKFDQAANQFVTSQPYTIGTLLKSSNASTWTPVQESDLAFRIYAASFSSTTRTVALGTLQIGTATITRNGGTATAVLPGHGRITGHSVAITGADQSEYNGVKVITVTGPDTFTFAVSGSPASPATGTISVSQAKVTDLVALAGVDRVSSATDVEFVFTTASGTQIRGSDNARIQLAEEVNEPLTLSAILRGTTTESPYLFANSQAVLGDLSETGNYVSRAVPCAAGARVTVTFEALIPGASSVVVEVQKADGTWQAVSLTTSAPVGDGWIEQIHTIAAFAAGGTETRARLTLSGTAAARPEVRQLRMVVI